MKKQFIVGMMILSTTISFSAHAATGTVKPVREVLMDYVKEIKKYAFEGKTSASDLNTAQTKKANDKMMNDLKLSANEKTAINSASTSAKDKAAFTNSLATILAAKNMAAGKSDAHSLAVNKAADSALKLMANSDLIGAKKVSKVLSTAELAEVNEAATKLSSMPEKYLTFETKELESYTKVLDKADELALKNDTYEDAFVLAIMEVQGVSKEKAMEIVRKLKDCV